MQKLAIGWIPAPDDCSLGAVHCRGGRTEFELGRRYAASPDPLDRKVGAEVLAQLGWRRRTFLDESMEILLPMLRDPETEVVIAAAYALWHRNDPRAIPEVRPLAAHPDPDVRRAVVSALSSHDDDAAIAGLIRLAADAANKVRDWAAFGLGTLLDRDTPEIRGALAALLRDEDAEIRGEAMIGLAKRRDPRALGAVAEELCGPFEGSWCLEAAEFLATSDLHQLLLRARERAPDVDRVKFAADFDRAIAACRPKE